MVGSVLAAGVVAEAEAVLEGVTVVKDPWTWEPSRPASYTPPNILFTGAMPGPSGIAVGVTDPLACFHLFLPPELYDDILQQTNLYATQQRALKGDTRPFTPINKTELMAFIGINIAMGIVSLPAIRNSEGDVSFVRTRRQPHGEEHSEGQKPRHGVPSVSSIYAWGSVLSYTTPDFITETTRLQAGSHWNHNKDARSFWNHLATLQELVSHNKLFD